MFNKGRRLYPQSVRTILGLGAAIYAQGLKEEAGRIFLEASDLDPVDPTPYLFLSRMQALETGLPSGWTDRMKRFVLFHPENAVAHYLYAIALSKQAEEQQNNEVVESQLKTAVELDPHLGGAYLQIWDSPFSS